MSGEQDAMEVRGVRLTTENYGKAYILTFGNTDDVTRPAERVAVRFTAEEWQRFLTFVRTLR